MMMSWLDNFADNFHFLRPWWLVLLVLLVPLFFALRRQQNLGGAWAKVCDVNLLPSLLVKGAGKAYSLLAGLLVFAFTLAVIAIAGPTWQKLPQVSVAGGVNTVFVLDMGLNMAANDVNPSRLDRAKFKIYDMLGKIGGDQAALILFDNESYVASPLSEDLSVIANIIPTLEMNVMPGNGESALGKGVDEAVRLLESAGLGNGRIIVLTGAGEAEVARAYPFVQKAAAKGNAVFVLALGSETGAPVPNEKGGFYTDAQGKTALFKTDLAGLEKLAKQGKGGFSSFTVGEADVDAVIIPLMTLDTTFKEVNLTADTWQDMGIYLLFIILPIVLFAFKRGFIAVFILALFNPWQAHAGWWQDLWFTPNQQAEKSLDNGDYSEAAQKFKDTSWKGYAHYKAGEYKDAATAFMAKDDAESLYNLGNSLAFSGDIPGAIEAYEKAIAINEKHEDAIFNRDYLKQMQQQQQQQQQENQQQQQQSDSSESEQEQQEQQDRQNQGQDQQDRQQEQEQDKEQQQNQESEPEPQPSEPQDKQDEQDKQDAGGVGAAEQESDVSEEEQADKQWLNRIDEDKGGLIRARLKKIYINKNGGY